MRGLTVRLALSYLVFALVLLVGAGSLSYSVLVDTLSRADQQAAAEKVLTAEELAVRLCGERSTPDWSALAREVEAAVSGVSVRPLTEAKGPEAIPAGADPFYVARIASGAEFRCPLQIVAMQEGDSPRVAALRLSLLGAGGLGLVAAVVMAFLFSRSLSAPLERIAFAAGRLAQGDWSVTMPTSGPQEVRDLSESFRSMAARLRQDFEKLRSDRESLQQLAAEVAHEIKTPVAALRTYHELLLDGVDEDPVARGELLRRGALQVERLQYLAQFLVEMVRLESHLAPLNLVEADLRGLVLGSVAGWEPSADQAGVRLVLEVPPDSVGVLVDVQRFGQALDNLLQNAMRWSPRGGSVRVRLAVSDQQAEITVADEGPGIPTAMVEHLFEPFVRGRSSEGMGLGLAIVRAVAEAHGGSVMATNRSEGGALFTLTLPRQESQSFHC